jgi:hypothetical protein
MTEPRANREASPMRELPREARKVGTSGRSAEGLFCEVGTPFSRPGNSLQRCRRTGEKP